MVFAHETLFCGTHEARELSPAFPQCSLLRRHSENDIPISMLGLQPQDNLRRITSCLSIYNAATQNTRSLLLW